MVIEVSEHLKKYLLQRIKYAVINGQSDEEIKSELFLFYYCISDIKKDKNGKSMIHDFSTIKVSDKSVADTKYYFSMTNDKETIFVLLKSCFLSDSMTEEEHKENVQKVLDKARERRIRAYWKQIEGEN